MRSGVGNSCISELCKATTPQNVVTYRAFHFLMDVVQLLYLKLRAHSVPFIINYLVHAKKMQFSAYELCSFLVMCLVTDGRILMQH
jgi:hypothetical protein